MLRYLSICSGIEAASVAWEPLGFRPAGFSEIEPFPSAVLAERFGAYAAAGLTRDEIIRRNGVPNFGDFTAIDPAAVGPVDILVGGTPCQAFSIAGRRMSLADARGNLTLAFAVLAHDLADNNGLRCALWENVPGVLSTEDNAFGCFLSALVGADDALRSPLERGRWPNAGMVAGPRARVAWRLFDAQHFGLAQRRARVFVVADLGGGPDPAAVLFEPKGLSGNFAAGREAGQCAAQDAGSGFAFGGGNTGLIDVVARLTAKGQRCGFEVETFVAEVANCLKAKGNDDHAADLGNYVAHTLFGNGFDASEDGTGRGTPLVPVAVAFPERMSGTAVAAAEDISPALCSANPTAVAFSCKDYGADASALAPTLRAMGHGESHANAGGQVAVAFSCIPIDMRQASRGATMTNNRPDGVTSGGAPGTGIGDVGDPSPTVASSHVPAVAFDLRGREGGAQFEGPHDTANIRASSGGSSRSYVATNWAVRRLTDTECERLQGFPDGHTAIAWGRKGADECPGGPRYKAIGNSKAVPVVRWLGRRIAANWPASHLAEAAR